MAKLLLIKHAAPLIDPAINSHRWKLSEAGRASCAPLATAISKHSPTRIISSVEPKAAETAQLVADALSLQSEQRSGLHEHDRSNVPHMRSRDFISSIELFFRCRRECVLGLESAADCAERFEAAVREVLSEFPDDNTAIVAHGTVISLYLAARSQTNGFEIWRRMQLPSFAVVDVQTDEVIELVDRLGQV